MNNKLNTIFKIDARMRALGNQLEFLNCQLCTIRKENKGEKPCVAYDCISKIKELTKEEFDMLSKERLDIYKLIAGIENKHLRTLLEYRFVYFMTYEDIAEITNYSLRQTMRNINRAINEIQKVDKKVAM